MARTTSSHRPPEVIDGPDTAAPNDGAGFVDVSIVVPTYNEVESLPHLVHEIHAALASLDRRWELVCADDGSTDGSFGVLKAIAAVDDRVVVVRLRRNFGQTAALAAGIDHASGAVVVLLDADLQNDPADIPRLLAKLDEGYDVVSGWRQQRVESFWTRRLPSMAANALISWVTGIRLHDYGCTLKAYRRDVIEPLRLYGEMHRLIPAYAAWSGARIVEEPVHHRPRRFGRSKYGILRTLKVILDLVTAKFLVSYLTKPSYVFGGAGLTLIGVGGVLTTVVAVQKLVFHIFVYRNPLALMAGLIIVGGLQMLLMGLLAELMVRTYHESQGRPTYLVAEIVNGVSSSDVRHRRVRSQLS